RRRRKAAPAPTSGGDQAPSGGWGPSVVESPRPPVGLAPPERVVVARPTRPEIRLAANPGARAGGLASGALTVARIGPRAAFGARNISGGPDRVPRASVRSAMRSRRSPRHGRDAPRQW